MNEGIPKINQEGQDEKLKIEVLTNELNAISEKVKTEWVAFLQSRDIENTDIFRRAKSAVENMIPHADEKPTPSPTYDGNTAIIHENQSPHGEAWREVAQKMEDVKDLIRTKAQEILKPVYDFRQKLESETSDLTGEEIKSLTALSMQPEADVLHDLGVKAFEDLKDTYKSKAKDYSKILETR